MQHLRPHGQEVLLAVSGGIDSVVIVTQLVTNATTPALRIHFTDLQQ